MHVALAALTLLAACAATPPQEPPAGPSLAETEWLRIDDDNAAPHFPTLNFTERGASGHAGCNRWFSSVLRSGDAMTFGNIGTTRMACAEPAMAAERNFIAALNDSQGMRMEGDELVLYDIGGAQTARFRPNN